MTEHEASTRRPHDVPCGDATTPAGRGDSDRDCVDPHDIPAALLAATEEGAPASTVEPTLTVSRDKPIDRGEIIGRDGRWAAGWALRFIIIAAAASVLWLALGKIWSGLLPILLSILLTSVFWPPVRWLRNHKVPAALAAGLVLVGGFGLIAAVFTAMAPRVADQSQMLYRQATEGVSQLQLWLHDGPLKVGSDQIEHLANEAFTKMQEQATNIASGVAAGLSTATSVAVTTLLMLVLTFFFLKDGDKFLPWLRRNTGQNVGWHLTEVLIRTWNTIGGYIRAQALVSFIDAILIGIGLMLLGVPLAFVLAVLTFFAGFIPIVGAVSAGAISVLVALVSNGPTAALMVTAMILVVQQLEGNVLSPMLQSKAMDLHPAIVLLSVAVGGGLFGIVGAFLSVPVAASVAVWMRYHADLVSLRTGEITVDDIEIATAQGSSKHMTPSEGLHRMRDRFSSLMPRQRILADGSISDNPSDLV